MRYGIEYTRLDHNKSEKEYAIDLIMREDGATLLIFAWGKFGSPKKLQTHFFKPSERKRAHIMRDKKYRDKLARDYSDNSANLYERFVKIKDEQGLMRLYRNSDNWWDKIPENHRKLITTNGFEEPPLQDVVLNAEIAQADMVDFYANHPLYGRF